MTSSLSENDVKVIVHRASAMDAGVFARALARLGLFERLRSATFIVVKPNLCAGATHLPGPGVVTCRADLEQLLAFVREQNRGAEISVVESDTVWTGWAYERFDGQDYAELAANHGAKLVDLSRTRLRLYRPARPLYFRRGVWLSSVFSRSDFFISVAKLKTHAMAGMSTTLKNLFGCLPEAAKEKHHPWLHEAVVDLLQVIRPDLSLVEGVPALEGHGPLLGTPVHTDCLVLGSDPVATDAVCARILGLPARRIKHLRLAERLGLGGYDADSLDLIGWNSLEAILGRRAATVSLETRAIAYLGLQIQVLGQWLARLGFFLQCHVTLRRLIVSVGGVLMRKLVGQLSDPALDEPAQPRKGRA